MKGSLVSHVHPSRRPMTLLLHLTFFIQVVGWACAEGLQTTSSVPRASSSPIVGAPHTSLKPLIPLIIGSVLGGFFGFLLIVFVVIYLVRRRRSKDVDDVVESAHFPTIAYNPNFPMTSPPISANYREYNPYVGYSHWRKPEERAPSMPPGLPVPTIRS
ncbi:hypothetical protein OPQ81_000665 [Rhizoctonia solani]|nr:hypothetical protein OPQ81_000665 [Rhizoctonia solani]